MRAPAHVGAVFEVFGGFHAWVGGGAALVFALWFVCVDEVMSRVIFCMYGVILSRTDPPLRKQGGCSRCGSVVS